ncbi:MAG: hypothetical protein HUU41_06985 [Bryobacteraceae bacterium]|nr:hypothetical protein [Bryobacterales bacterium]MEB2360898.1 hypothetical protein [Bryobacterales bacterium]NUN00840.1 hypothetical protein [Bryobacteraceae bacterium]
MGLKTTIITTAVLAAVILLARASGETGLRDREKEEFLKTAKIQKIVRLTTGTTGTEKAVLSDGRITHDVHVQTIDVYKPIFRGKSGIEKNFRDSYKFNIAGYRLARILGMENVPVSVERTVDGKPGSFTWWVDDVILTELDRKQKRQEPPDPNRWTHQMDDIRVFDQLIHNTDRNQGNLLIAKDWTIWAIDHTRAFREDPVLRDPGVLERISERLLNALRKLERPVLTASLEPWISSKAVDALLARRDLIVKYFDQAIAQKGRYVVLTGVIRETPHATIP